jgi:cytochrome c biogenesis protein CcdA/thiol-disulfide isomerase/thioredoxin
MLLIIVAYLGGALTIVSPCILPVLPFVFARSDQPFRKSGLPLLLAMALTFALIGTLAALGGGWAVTANQWGRYLAMLLLTCFGIMLLFPALAEHLMRPLVALGNRLSTHAGTGNGFGSSFLLGIATGLLWAPCAGPVLGLILATAALSGASWQTAGLLLAYAAGAITSLALALLAGNRVFHFLKRSLGAGVWIRRGLGIAVLGGVFLVATGMDRGVLTRVSAANTDSLEQTLLDHAGLSKTQKPVAISSENSVRPASDPASVFPVEGKAPELAGVSAWINSNPLTMTNLRGKVVLIDFWTYSCINCLRTLPHVQSWHDHYKKDGLVVIGVHTPEFAFEHDLSNVRQAVKRLGIVYSVALDNDYDVWRAFDNHYWPAEYLIDARGRIRYHHFGEGDYQKTESAIQSLLAEAGSKTTGGFASTSASGVKTAADFADIRSPETYIGYDRAEGFMPGPVAHDTPMDYTLPKQLQLNDWGLGGNWTVTAERAILNDTSGSIVFYFHARDLNLVLGPGAHGKPIHFQVLIDGQSPGRAHGVDTDADGRGVVTAERLYQLVRQKGKIGTHQFEIHFSDPGASAYAFTFG